jgi:hypothetical protein
MPRDRAFEDAGAAAPAPKLAQTERELRRRAIQLIDDKRFERLVRELLVYERAGKT